MLIRKLSKRRCSEMISQLNNRFISPSVSENYSSILHCSPFQKFSRAHRFHNLEPALDNAKFPIAGSSAQPGILLSVDRAPRIAKADAQASLFDYLHCTRGFTFLDAEHISKNSPMFVQELIEKVEFEQDVSRALPKFFRYHPVNEFEPFFESIGLKPNEFTSLLPRDLMFLSDNQLLLDNYHTLCDYGIPRSKIGRMYREANEIFRYEFGVLDLKLRSYEQLGLSRSTVIKLVSCSPLLLVAGLDNEFVEVLKKLKQIGFDNNWIGGYLSSKNTYDWKKVLDTLSFLREVGYSDENLLILFSSDSALLFEGSGKQVYVFVGALLKLGLNMNEISALFLENPQMLSRKCAKNFWKALHLLIEIGMETEFISKIFSSHMKLLVSHTIKGPRTVLRSFNGDKHILCETIKRDPISFFSTTFDSNIPSIEHREARNPNNLIEKTEFLTRIGYLENSDEMVKALKRFRGRGDQLQERFDCLVQAGLDFNAVSSMVKQAPTVLNQTKDILEKKIECLKKYLGYPVESIVAFPSYLCYDMERISQRFSMYVWLREKGAVKPTLSISTLMACSDARFEKYFVDVHPEGPVMWESLKKSLTSS